MGDFFKAAWQNIKDLPRDIVLVFGDKHRRRNFIWRVCEALIEMLVFFVALSYGLNILLSLFWGWLAGFIAFEYIAEPAEFTGFYYERGPREHEGEWPNTGWWEE